MVPRLNDDTDRLQQRYGVGRSQHELIKRGCLCLACCSNYEEAWIAVCACQYTRFQLFQLHVVRRNILPYKKPVISASEHFERSSTCAQCIVLGSHVLNDPDALPKSLLSPPVAAQQSR
jgi:hypothetical protein